MQHVPRKRFSQNFLIDRHYIGHLDGLTEWPERVKLMQEWADLIDNFKKQAVAA